ncbi:general secretion pathway protein GspC [Marinobacter sp. F4216]|nr:type II secretion system protein N [Marinobacter sp. F4216]MBZ2168395.1 general secretion pathway protein GspC [Marinobacter sp. F4216]
MMAMSLRAQTRLSRALANVLLVGLAIYLALALAKVTWLLIWDERPVPSTPTALDGGNNGGGSALSAPMASFEFFGRPEQQQGVSEVVKRSAPETQLRLRLEGVLLGQRPEDSGAIVAGSNGETGHYRVGDMLPGNVELAEVEAGRILIRRGGRYESLTFEDGSETLVAQTPEQPAQSSPDAFLDQARAQLDTEGAAALNAYGLRPAGDSGQSGYVYDGSNAMLNAVNLQAGDVITSINGQILGDIEQDKSLFDSWRDQAQLDIEIERDGSFLTISFAIPEQWR